jgi:bacteriocin biosynthesis cyclodehydratase domain-containing protein
MFHRPQFKPQLRVEVVPGEGVFLLSERHQTVLEGKLFEMVAPWLDGRPVEEICDRLRGQATPAHVFYTLAQLEKRGYLTEASVAAGRSATLDQEAGRSATLDQEAGRSATLDQEAGRSATLDYDARPAAESALWAEQQVDSAAAACRLAETPVTIRAVGAVDIAPLQTLLRSLGVRTDGEPALTVVVTDGYLRRDLRSWNKEALQDGRPWLLVKPVGRWVWFGPLFVPGKTGCWACLAERLQANAPVLAYLEAKRGLTGEFAAHHAATPATLQTAWGLAATAVASWVGRGDLPHLEGKVRSLDVLTAESQTHTLVRLPSCGVCGEAIQADRPVQPVVVGRGQKVYTEDGGHRVCSPQQTLERFGHHVSPITGAVSMLERDGSSDGVMHVYLAGPNSARRARNLQGLRADLRSSNCGKGTTDAQAKASALCEGLERYSGAFRGDEPRRRARLADLGDAGIAPNTCLLFSDRQYRERDVWNAAGHAFDAVPLPFDPKVAIDWTPVWSLSRQAERYLPAAYCWFNYPQSADRVFCFACSNGNAAGNTVEEAILQGFLELVERDSVALWWYNRVRRPGIDLSSFNEPYLGQLEAFLRDHHRDLWALDVTSDLGVPTVVAVSRRTDGGAEQIMFGLGAHLDARIALLRAVTELNQMLSPLLNVPAADPAAGHLTDRATLHWLRTATMANQPYLEPLDGPLRRAADFPLCGSDNLKDDILFCQALAERQGSELLVLDQTRPEIGLPVVKVIVPGMRHFWARFAPGRLYDVPVKLGWLPQPRTEAELNPIPMFL